MIIIMAPFLADAISCFLSFRFVFPYAGWLGKLLSSNFVLVGMSDYIPIFQRSCSNEIIDPKLRYVGDGLGNFVTGKKIILLQLD